MSKIINDSIKEQVITFYQTKPMSLDAVAKQFNLCTPTILKILKDVPKYPKHLVSNPDLDETFFTKIDSESKAYFLGLIISDGNVFAPTNGRSMSTSITLDSNDEYLLKTFKESIKTNTAISHDGRGCSQVAVRSNKIANDLASYGVIPNKSFYTYLPEIPDQLMPHLIRGIFDGDGSIRAQQTNIRNKYAHAFSFCGSHQLMEDISNYLYNYLNLEIKPKVYDYKDRKLSELKIQNKHDMHVFGEWMYKNATILMDRKKHKYDEFKEHYQFNNTEIPR